MESKHKASHNVMFRLFYPELLVSTRIKMKKINYDCSNFKEHQVHFVLPSLPDMSLRIRSPGEWSNWMQLDDRNVSQTS